MTLPAADGVEDIDIGARLKFGDRAPHHLPALFWRRLSQ
jgi:hypothetical protein